MKHDKLFELQLWRRRGGIRGVPRAPQVSAELRKTQTFQEPDSSSDKEATSSPTYKLLAYLLRPQSILMYVEQG